MGLQKHCGSFILNNTSGSQSITGVGFQPTIVMFFSALNWGWGDTVNAGWEQQFGAAVSSSQRFTHSAKYLDNFTPSNIPGRNLFSSSFCINITGFFFLSGSDIFGNRITADLVSMDSDGFTLNVTVDSTLTAGALQPFPTDTEVYYLALGGTDLSAAVGTISPAAADAGTNKSVTGLSFQPQVVLLVGRESGSKNTEAPFNIGLGVSSSNRLHCSLYGTDGSGITYGTSQVRTTRVFKAVNDADFTQSELDFVSVNSDGFTLSVGTQATTTPIGYIALGGTAQFDIGQIAGATSTGNQDVTCAIAPEAMILFGDGKVSHADLSTPLRPSFGFAVPGVSNVGLGAHIINGVNPTDVATRKDNTKSLISVDGNTAAVAARGSVTQANSPGFRINWSETDAVARIFNFLAIQSAANGGATANPSNYPLSAAGVAGLMDLGLKTQTTVKI